MAKNYKIVVYVPVANAEELREAMGEAGAGKFGKYNHCSFSVRGTGRFRPEKGAHPHIGVIGKKEEVEEERVEVRCEESVLQTILKAVKRVHPYEEIGIDIYPLEEVEISEE